MQTLILFPPQSGVTLTKLYLISAIARLSVIPLTVGSQPPPQAFAGPSRRTASRRRTMSIPTSRRQILQGGGAALALGAIGSLGALSQRQAQAAATGENWTAP